MRRERGLVEFVEVLKEKEKKKKAKKAKKKEIVAVCRVALLGAVFVEPDTIDRFR